MNADDMMSYSTPYLAAIRLLAKAMDQASIARFSPAVELATQAAEQITSMVQEFERLSALYRMRSETTLIQRHCVLPGERAA